MRQFHGEMRYAYATLRIYKVVTLFRGAESFHTVTNISITCFNLDYLIFNFVLENVIQKLHPTTKHLSLLYNKKSS